MEEDSRKRAEVNANVNTLPHDIMSRVSHLSERERNVKQNAEKCKNQILEIQMRSDTLQQYADHFIEMDTKLKEAQNLFEEEYEEELNTIADQEDEYLHKLAALRQQKQQNEQALAHFAQMSATILDTISKCNEEDTHLDQDQTKAVYLSEEAKKQIAQVSIEKIDFEVDQIKTKLAKINQKIGRTEQKIQDLRSKGKQILDDMNQEIIRTKKLNSEIASFKIKSTEENDKIQNEIQETNQSTDQYHSSEIYALAQQKILRASIEKFKNLIYEAKKKLNEANDQLKPHNKKLNERDQEVKAIRKEVNQYEEAVIRHREFERGISSSSQRANLRAEEILKSIESIYTQKKKISIDQFLEQEKIENYQTEENKISESLEQVEHDMNMINEEESQIKSTFMDFSERFDSRAKLEAKQQKTYQDALDLLRELKDKLIEPRKEEKELVKRMKALKNGAFKCEGPELEEEKRRHEVIQRGYDYQITFTQDQCVSLQKAVKTEELKNAIAQSEYKRFTSSKGSMMNSEKSVTIQELEQRKADRKRKLQSLHEKIKGLEGKKNYLHTKLINARYNIQQRSSSDVDNNINDTSEINQDAFNKLNHNEKVEAFCKEAEKIYELIKNAISGFQSTYDSSRTKTQIKEWNDTISSVLDATEDSFVSVS